LQEPTPSETDFVAATHLQLLWALHPKAFELQNDLAELSQERNAEKFDEVREMKTRCNVPSIQTRQLNSCYSDFVYLFCFSLCRLIHKNAPPALERPESVITLRSRDLELQLVDTLTFAYISRKVFLAKTVRKYPKIGTLTYFQ
jgi:hypothetical protein